MYPPHEFSLSLGRCVLLGYSGYMNRPPILDYERRDEVTRPVFRIGAVSTTISLLALLVIVGELLLGGGPAIVRCGLTISAVGFWTGVVGLVQRSGRRLAVYGIITAMLAVLFAGSY